MLQKAFFLMRLSGIGTTGSCPNLPDYVHISTTTVWFKDGDVIGLIFAWSSLLPIAIALFVVMSIYFKREIISLWKAFGQLIETAWNVTLKRIISQPRPKTGPVMASSDHGMPSNHSQFTWYFCTMNVWLLWRKNGNLTTTSEKIFKTMIYLVTALMVTTSRVYLQYHTVEQVVVGSLLGILDATIYYFIGEWFIFNNIFQRIEKWSILQKLYFKDSSYLINMNPLKWEQLLNQKARGWHVDEQISKLLFLRDEIQDTFGYVKKDI